jgi:hypothetical protein
MNLPCLALRANLRSVLQRLAGLLGAEEMAALGSRSALIAGTDGALLVVKGPTARKQMLHSVQHLPAAYAQFFRQPCGRGKSLWRPFANWRKVSGPNGELSSDVDSFFRPSTTRPASSVVM